MSDMPGVQYFQRGPSLRPCRQEHAIEREGDYARSSIYSWPAWTGTVLYRENKKLIGSHICPSFLAQTRHSTHGPLDSLCNFHFRDLDYQFLRPP